jgi:hypothetical protein
VPKILAVFAFYECVETTALLMRYRQTSKDWKNHIESLIPRINTFTRVYSTVCNILAFDKSQYDQYHYERMLLKSKIEADGVLTMPVINTEELWLDETEFLDQFVVGHVSMPDEYHIFMNLWREFPSTTIRPVPLWIMRDILDVQHKKVEVYVLDAFDDTSIANIVTYLPIVYSTDAERFDDEPRYMHVLCYINVVDKNLETDFPVDSERFCIIDVQIDNLILKTTCAKDENTFAPGFIRTDSSDEHFAPGDVITVMHSNDNDGRHVVETHHDGLITIAASRLTNENTKGVLVMGDPIITTFRNFRKIILAMSEKIRLAEETLFLPKNVASELCEFSKLFKRLA